MIVLKIIVDIVLAVLGTALGLILLVLILPIKAEMSFLDGDINYKFKYSFLTLADSNGGKTLLEWYRKRKRKGSKKKPKKNKEPEPDDDWELYSEPDYVQEVSDEEKEEKERTEKISKIKNKKSKNIKDNSEKPKKKSEPKNNDTEFEYDDFSDDESPEPKRRNIGQKIDKLLDIWEQLERPVLKILRGVHIYDVFIDFIVTDPDAYRCALLYGSISGTVYNLLAWLSTVFTVKFRTVDVQCGFAQKQDRWDTSFKVSFRLIVLAVAVVWFAFLYIFKIFLPKKLKGRKAEKA